MPSLEERLAALEEWKRHSEVHPDHPDHRREAVHQEFYEPCPYCTRGRLERNESLASKHGARHQGGPDTLIYGDDGTDTKVARSTHDHSSDSTVDHGALGGLTDDDHTQYRLESEDHSHASSGLQGGTVSHDVLTGVSADDHHAESHTVPSHSGTPGGELGGTWTSPTVDATHSGSAHHAEAHTVASHSAMQLLFATGDYFDYDTGDDEFSFAIASSEILRFGDGEYLRGPRNVRPFGIMLENPTSSEDASTPIYIDEAFTITKMVAVLVGSSTPSVTWTVRHSTDRSAAGNQVVTGGTTTTSTTTGSVVTSFNDASVDANSFVWIETTAQSGTVNSIAVCIIGYYNLNAA